MDSLKLPFTTYVKRSKNFKDTDLCKIFGLHPLHFAERMWQETVLPWVFLHHRILKIYQKILKKTKKINAIIQTHTRQTMYTMLIITYLYCKFYLQFICSRSYCGYCSIYLVSDIAINWYVSILKSKQSAQSSSKGKALLFNRGLFEFNSGKEGGRNGVVRG